MKILIIESEIYLAQSIATKLGEQGHICEMCTSTKDAIKSNNYDVVLLSTNIKKAHIQLVFHKYNTINQTKSIIPSKVFHNLNFNAFFIFLAPNFCPIKIDVAVDIPINGIITRFCNSMPIP